jgi:hypothetical protein
MTILYRPQNNPNGLYYAPQHSMLYRFPDAVAIALTCCDDPQSPMYKLLREDFKLSEEDIESVFRFFEEYFTTLLEQKTDVDPYTAFRNAGLPELGDSKTAVFHAVFSAIVPPLMTMYHEMLVESGNEAYEKYQSIARAVEILANRNTEAETDGVAGA